MQGVERGPDTRRSPEPRHGSREVTGGTALQGHGERETALNLTVEPLGTSNATSRAGADGGRGGRGPQRAQRQHTPPVPFPTPTWVSQAASRVLTIVELGKTRRPENVAWQKSKLGRHTASIHSHPEKLQRHPSAGWNLGLRRGCPRFW